MRTLPTRTVVVAAGLLLAAALSLGFAHRATHSRGDDRRAIVHTVRTYEAALMSGDGKAACSQLTSRARHDLLTGAAAAGLGDSCQGVAETMRAYVQSLIDGAPSPARAAAARRTIENPSVEVVSIDGDRATARVEDSSRYPIPLERGDGGWKIARLPSPVTETQ